MLHAVIMAGGAGTRFWPESRADRPKQLLDFLGGQTMIQATVGRLGSLVPPERVLVLTNRRLVEAIAAALPELPAEAIVGEPCKRDTAACIGLAAFHVARHDPQATMAVVPSDHVIRPAEKFQQAIGYAAELVEQRPSRIVTFGIPPTYPAESFGYVERGEPLAEDSHGMKAYRVARFREKPQLELAEQYLATSRFYWNAGIFVWKAHTILEALRANQPQMYERLQAIESAAGRPDYPAVLEAEFSAIKGISIDYAVMEKADDVVVLEAPFEWDDVGSWQALARLRGADADGNTIDAPRFVSVRTSGTIVRSTPEHLIATLGVKDLIIVHTPDATLVAHKHDEEAIRQLVKLIEQQGWGEYL